MTEPQRDVLKYSSHPVFAQGGLAELGAFLAQLLKLDRKAERRARFWLGPAGWLRRPLMAWARLREPWRFVVGIVTVPIWAFPMILALTLFLPFTLIWSIGYALLARKDISNDLLEICGRFLAFWKESGEAQQGLSLTVDARLPLLRTREIKLADLSEDSPPGLTSAAETSCFRFEAPGLQLQVMQQFRVLDSRAGTGEAITNLLAKTQQIEGQSWYTVHVERNGHKQQVTGSVHSLRGRAGKRNKLVDFHGESLRPEFPWAELTQALKLSHQQLECEQTRASES